MEDKHKDTVFGVALFVLGAYVTLESVRMVELAANPPLRIKQLPISPGFFPLVLGGLLMLLSVLLVANSLRGSENPLGALGDRLKRAILALRAFSGDADFRDMTIGLVMMFAYCFIVIGTVPFWCSATAILLVMMIFLRLVDRGAGPARAADFVTIVVVSVASVGATILLFENVFGTILP